MKSRQAVLERLKAIEEVPVLIIGAGVNGIGTFRDLALQGVDVVMVDKGDFCSGASMASSHMLHGGVRYLENGEFRLVREALRERNRLLRNAPHLTQPLPTTIPIFKRFSGLLNAPLKFLGLLDRPSERGALVIKIGLTLYDAFARRDNSMPAHRFLSRQEALASWPALNPAIIKAASYFDGFMPSPERICLELIADAERDNSGALALNYVRLIESDGSTVLLQEEGGEEISLQPRVIINAAGPWIDLTNRRLDVSTQFIGGTKGSHLILDHPRLRRALVDHEFFFEYVDGRIVLILPYLDKVMIGTTDIRVDDPDQTYCTEEEIDYLLGMVPTVFPGIEVGRENIIFQFSGVRPLHFSGEKSAGRISRDHQLEIIEPGRNHGYAILNLVGGKWTTYRAFSEKTTDEVLRRLNTHRRASTADLAIGGGSGFPMTEAKRAVWIEERSGRNSVPVSYVGQLLNRYGTRADQYLAAVEAAGANLLPTEPQYALEELRALIQHERVWHVDDLVLRRTLLAWTGQLSRPLLVQLCDLLAEELNLSEAAKERELERTLELLRENHGLIFE